MPRARPTAPRVRTALAAEIISIVMPLEEPTYRLGVRLLAVLAYPPKSEHDTRWMQAERALGHIYCMAHLANAAGWLEKPQLVVPNFLTLTSAKARSEDRRIAIQLGHRMGAAHMAVPYFQEAAASPSTSPRLRNSKSIDSNIMRTIEQEQDRREVLNIASTKGTRRFPEQADNFDARVLRPSLPVLHLAVATALAIDRSQKALAKLHTKATVNVPNDVAGPQLSAADIMNDPMLARMIIEEATHLESFLPRLSVLKPKSIVRLILA